MSSRQKRLNSVDKVEQNPGLFANNLRGTQRFVSGNINSEGLNCWRKMKAVKISDFFGETSPQTFVTGGTN